jgi:hypothetical protein
MKSLVVIAFFQVTTVHSQQMKIQETIKTFENFKDSIDRYFCTKKITE